MQGMVTVLKAKARIMRAFLWTALGKGCIRMRQDRAESVDGSGHTFRIFF